MEVVIADGLSTDGTWEAIAQFQKDFPDLCVRVVENPKRSIPAGLNRAIEAARGEILLRLDGHSKPYPDYVTNCVFAHTAGRGANVGVSGDRPRRDWIANHRGGRRHPLGVGDKATPRETCEVDSPLVPGRH
jgi:glycosyltransferase involved in cell wall biosynthesis